MCGIVGQLLFEKTNVVDGRLLRQMTDIMTHRGPDDAGYWVNGRIGLGHRRLSIIDLSPAGRQPMCNEDSTVWTVFNGEIYNFKELRRELESHGHSFSSQTDSEVIIHGYEEWGLRQCLERLQGMFALILWDEKKEQMFVVRDRLGIKPLYYWHDKSSLIAASELKAILQHPGVPKKVDRQALLQHFAYRYALPPRTIFEGICKLPAGHYLAATDNQVKVEEYWRPNADQGSADGWDEDAYAAELQRRLRETVGSHLVSDVPLGAFLSGGLDSSSLVGLMTELMDQPVKTYTAGFGGGWHDETTHARAAATFNHTEHHEIACRAGSVDLLKKIIWHLEEPLINTSVIPLYLVAQLASQDVKVVLAGDGSDEVNGGYRKYALIEQLLRLRRWRQLIPGVDPAANSILGHLPLNRLTARLKHLNAITQNRGAGCLALSSTVLGNGNGTNPAFFSPDIMADISSLSYEAENVLLDGYRGVADPRQQFFIYDMRGWLENELLIRADKMTMAHSLEARVPYLDHKLVEFCLRIPSKLKIKDGSTKSLLRQAMRKYVQEATARREQHGFVVPLGQWFRHELREFVQDLSHDRVTRGRGYFDFKQVDKAVESHLNGTADRASAIYGLIMVELWHRTFIDE
jgi:asparagine synthase (glutamine-hydrolysing)